MLAAAAAFLLVAGGARATTYSEAFSGEDLSPALSTAGELAWGDAFTAPGAGTQVLDSWSFVTGADGNAGGTDAIFVVAPFDETTRQLSGSPLYKSAPTEIPTGANATFAFTGLDVDLTGGDTYVAFLDVADGDTFAPIDFVLESDIPDSEPPPANGISAYGVRNFDGFAPDSTGDKWAALDAPDGPAFSADIVPLESNAVPEPASLSLLGAALLGLGAIRRRKRS